MRWPVVAAGGMAELTVRVATANGTAALRPGSGGTLPVGAVTVGVEAMAGVPPTLLVVGSPDGGDLAGRAGEAGFRLREVATPQEAVTLLVRGLSPLLAVVDARIGGVGTAVGPLRTAGGMPSGVPVVVLTQDCDQRREAGEAGAEVCLDLSSGSEEVARAVVTLARLVRSLRDQSPLTGLPGNGEIDLRLRRLAADPGTDYAVLYLDLDRFKAFNDRFGFHAGDEVLRMTARVLAETTALAPSGIDFVGHVGGDDFVIITTAARAECLCRQLITAFEAGMRAIIGDLTGNPAVAGNGAGGGSAPAVTISIGVATTTHRRLGSAWEAAAVATEMKQAAKQVPQSSFRVDYRRGWERGAGPEAAVDLS